MPSWQARETIQADWLGEKFAEMFGLAAMIALVREWHELPPEDPRPFVALASLRVAGFRIAASQQSIVSRLDMQVIVEIHHSLVGALVDRYFSQDGSRVEPYSLVAAVFQLVEKLIDVFNLHSGSKPSPPFRNWYVGKEVCGYLQSSGDSPNPEEVRQFADCLSNSMTGTKALLDELLDADVSIVRSAPGAV